MMRLIRGSGVRMTFEGVMLHRNIHQLLACVLCCSSQLMKLSNPCHICALYCCSPVRYRTGRGLIGSLLGLNLINHQQEQDEHVQLHCIFPPPFGFAMPGLVSQTATLGKTTRRQWLIHAYHEKKEKKGEKTVFFSAVYWGLVPLTLSATQRNVSQVGVPRIRTPAY